MDETEFDKFADEYSRIHERNLRLSGENPEYFAEYKVADVAGVLCERRFPTNLNILDFGAGVGTSTPYFKKYFPESDLTCLDVSKRSIDIGKSRFSTDATFIHFNGAVVPFPDETFDLVFLACVLHHISHSEHIHIFQELRRILRRGGIIFAFEHNPYNPLTLRAVNTCSFDENAVLLRPKSLISSLAAAGFDTPTLRYRFFFPHFLRFFRCLESRMTGIPFGAQYYVYAQNN